MNKKTKQLLVCSACARSMRGRYKLERVTDTVDYSCAMGTGKLNIQFIYLCFLVIYGCSVTQNVRLIIF